MESRRLIAQVCDTVAGFLQVGNEVFTAAGATFVRNRHCPRRYDANHVTQVRCPTNEALDTLFARVEQEFASFGHRRFDVDPLTPPALAARLVLADFACSETVHLVLHDGLRAAPRPFPIRLVDNEADWAAYARLQQEEWRELTQKRGLPYTADVVAEFVASKRLKSPAVRYWLAVVHGEACAYVCSWPGAGVGLIEDLFTLPAYRHRGIATALIAHAVTDLRRGGVGPILIGARSGDTPKHMYAAMGFRPLLLTWQYLRRPAPRGTG